MPDPFRKVRPGEDVEFSAIAHNRMLEAAQAYGTRTGAGDPVPLSRQATVIHVRNDAGVDLNRGGVVGIGDVLADPTLSEESFLAEVSFSGLMPGDAGRRFGILIDAIPQDQVGRAVIDGVCHVKVDVINEGHRHARPIDSDHGKLESCAHGYAEILWREGDGPYGGGYDTGVQWAVVRLGTFGPHLFRGTVTTAISGGPSSDGRADLLLPHGGVEEDAEINNDYTAGVAVGKKIVCYADEDGKFWLLTADC